MPVSGPGATSDLMPRLWERVTYLRAISIHEWKRNQIRPLFTSVRMQMALMKGAKRISVSGRRCCCLIWGGWGDGGRVLRAQERDIIHAALP